ncbi:hypothetical protein [uncultured Pseudoteredinibacter sp.]|uniref:hypothetical protein n=1 Tax=uncultured Pseudoteredinibacter sp. TaxID=1641701 RepID=UPI002608B2BD|nr:hypothetical protein [uncultured Pseudoteredinibacter sp.]
MTQALDKNQVKAVLAKNGIRDIDQLADLIASSSIDNPLGDNINPVAASWVVKVCLRFLTMPNKFVLSPQRARLG